MGENSAIEWTDHTFNPWVGCTKISPACDHCYAESWAKRTGGAHLWQGERRRTTAENWRKPIKWNREAQRTGIRRKVFCASLADVFDNQVPEEWRHDLWRLIAETPHLDWLLLTKRPQNIAKMLPPKFDDDRDLNPNYFWPWPNVWLGTTVENQDELRRIDHLRAVPAAVRFLSCEPLLEDLGTVDLTGISWVICGGESGPGARPMHPDWARSLREQCTAAGVPFFFKQWGEWAPQVGAVDGWSIDDNPEISRFDHLEWDEDQKTWGEPFRPMWCDWDSLDEEHVVSRIGKKRAGRLLDGRTHDEFPGGVAQGIEVASASETPLSGSTEGESPTRRDAPK